MNDPKTTEQRLEELEMGYKLADGDYPDLIDRTKSRRPTDDDMRALMSPELSTMPYADFLLTPYWLAVRRRVLVQDEHPHKTYEHRGAEWFHLADLAALCSICHASHHSKPIRDTSPHGLVS